MYTNSNHFLKLTHAKDINTRSSAIHNTSNTAIINHQSNILVGKILISGIYHPHKHRTAVRTRSLLALRQPVMQNVYEALIPHLTNAVLRLNQINLQ